MRKYGVFGGASAVLVVSISALFAQVPAAPAPPAGASGLLGLIQAAAGAIKKAKAKCCACPLGQMLQNAAKPLNTALGGLLCPPCCPPVNPDDLKQPSTLPAGACAKIMQEELEMPKRRKAIQCLARADCHWWPEAEAALIAGLRADRNECVRLEAAKALLTGCCCTKKTITALTITVSGSKKDGNPSENSERVKAMALAALQRCLTCYVDEEEPKPPEVPKKPAPEKPLVPPPTVDLGGIELPNLAYYDALDRSPSAPILEAAKKAARVAAAAPPQSETVVAGPSGSRNLYQLWVNAQLPTETPKGAAEPPAAAAAARLTPAPQAPASTNTPVASPGTTAQLEFRE